MRKHFGLLLLWAGSFLVLAACGNSSATFNDRDAGNSQGIDAFLKDGASAESGATGSDSGTYVTDGGGVVWGKMNMTCAAGQWCWQSPLPHGNSYRALWLSGLTNVYTIDSDGLAYRYNGQTWSAINISSSRMVLDIDGSGPNNIIAVGQDGLISKFDGSNWNLQPPSTSITLNSVWVGANNEAFAVGNQGTTVRYVNNVWTTISLSSSTTLNDVWSGDNTNVFTVGASGSLFRFDRINNVWSSYSGPTFTGDFFAIGGPNGNEIFITGSNGALFRSRPGAWAEDTIAGYTQNWNSLWGASTGQMFAVGEGGAVALRQAAKWTAKNSGMVNSLKVVKGLSANAVLVGGTGGVLLFYDGQDFKDPTASPTHEQLNDIWGASDSVAFAVGNKGTLLKYEQGAWKSIATGSTQNFNGVWGTSENDVYIVGNLGTILHYENGVLQVMDSPTSLDLRAIQGTAKDYIVAVGTSGMIIRYNGTSWSKINTSVSSYNFNDLWLKDNNTIYVVGDSGAIYIGDGNAANWSKIGDPIGSGYSYKSITGNSSTGDICVVSGEYAAIYCRTASTGAWNTLPSGTASGYLRIKQAGDDLYFSGADGSLWRYTKNTNATTAEKINSHNLIRGICVTSESNKFVVGAYGTILHYAQ